MKIIRINADEALWRNSMLPEGILERWLVADGDTARAGHAIAQVRIEGALHDIVAPATGRLAISAPTLAVIDPGFLLATLAVDAEVACRSLTCSSIGFIVSLLLDVRAHIPNQPSFGFGSRRCVAYGAPRIARDRGLSDHQVAFLSAVIWLAVRLIMGFL